MLEAIRSILSLGGPVVAVLLVLSIFALALILLKAWQFAAERVGLHGRARQAVVAWQQGRGSEAIEFLQADPSPLGAALFRAIAMSVHRASRRDIEEEVQRIATERLHALQKGFRALDAVAQVAPLLGLFGTVLGMIEAFRQLQGAGSAVDPSLLAGGIWVALLTTAVGLAVAMPVSLVLTWFETRLENERVSIETMTLAVLGHATGNSVADEDCKTASSHERREMPAHAH
ncbi:MotA/TolQ/ExbB proton channel family protein [Chelativorans sp. Marseille-P2723]|uniref:MotA/TolQ/ExbB proton channel family protein n=1 Tax=Chelativorans sp. Marseille-P2723 TaxID=2709133 RepID=UPI0015705690|nr:MotA/TolQ/ExbB proton channel family protein [Chelativorans sp. Marseille-P2723]